MNMYCWNITSRRFQTFINEKHLGHTACYEHVLLEYYIKRFQYILSMTSTWVMQNAMNMFGWNITSRRFQTFINVQQLGHAEHYEHVLIRTLHQ